MFLFIWKNFLTKVSFEGELDGFRSNVVSESDVIDFSELYGIKISLQFW